MEEKTGLDGLKSALDGRAADGKFAPGNPGNPTGRKGRSDSMADIPPSETQLVDAFQKATQTASKFNLDSGWINFLTGLGTHSHDKLNATCFTANVIQWPEAVELWRGNALAEKIITLEPREMLREPFQVRIAKAAADEDDSASKALADDIIAHWKQIGLKPNLFEALSYENAYGGGAVMLGINDGSDSLAEPLDEEHIINFDWLSALEPRELIPVKYYADPGNSEGKYGQTALFQLTPLMPGSPVEDVRVVPYTTLIHESRMLVFRGRRVSRAQVLSGRATIAGWGDSKLTLCNDALKRHGIAFGHAAQLLVDFAQPVYQFDELADMMKSEEGRQLITARLLTMDKARSILRAMVLDTKDKYERVQTPMAGLADLLHAVEDEVCMATGYPRVLLFGSKTGGLANGDAELELWENNIAARQEEKLEPALMYLARLTMKYLKRVAKQYSIYFCPLSQMTELEVATLRDKVADTDIKYKDAGVLTEDDIRDNRFGAEWSMETHLDDDDYDDEPDADDVDAYAKEQGTMPDGSDGAKPISTTAYQGPQIESMLEIVAKVNAKQLSKPSAIAMLRIAFSLSDEDATAVLGPDDFVPVAPPTPPAPTGFGAKPTVPGSEPKPTIAPAKPDEPGK